MNNPFNLPWFQAWIFRRFLNILIKSGFVEMDLSQNQSGFVDMIIFRHHSVIEIEVDEDGDG